MTVAGFMESSSWKGLLSILEVVPHVITSQDLPIGASSEKISVSNLQMKLSQQRFVNSVSNPLYLQASSGILEVPGVKSSTWIQHLTLAEDMHSESITMSFSHDNVSRIPSIVVSVSKNIKKGCPPCLWFSSELASQLGLPFLNFSHIKDGLYNCPQCSQTFMTPNPLKLHLATLCDTISSDQLWGRLFQCPELQLWSIPLLRNTQEQQIPQGYTGSLLIRELSPQTSKTDTPITLDMQTPSVPSSHTNRSAFSRVRKTYSHHPYQRYENGTNQAQCSVSASQGFLSWPILLPSPMVPIDSKFTRFESTLKEDCAEMESIVSNLGRGKSGGHLCLYCGKVYSRKYGLKIHIRTHTGYKPLRCKICQRPFGDPSNLNKHVRLHSEGNTPYRCEPCGKLLVRRRDLERHMKSRHPTVEISSIGSPVQTEAK